MKITLDLNKAVLQSARDEAARLNTSLDKVIEYGLILALEEGSRRPRNKATSLTVCTAGGGAVPGVNLDNPASLLDAMNQR